MMNAVQQKRLKCYKCGKSVFNIVDNADGIENTTEAICASCGNIRVECS